MKNIPKIKIVKSIYSGDCVEQFLESNNLKLKDVDFEKRYMNKWDNDESICVVGYRNATPEEIKIIEEKEEKQRVERLEYRRKEFERLKKEFEE